VSGRWLRGTGATLRFLSLGTGRPDAVRRDSVRRTLAKLIGGARHDSQQPAPSTERIKDFQTQELLPSPDLPRRLKFDCGRNDIQRLPGNAVPSPVCCSAGAPLILAPRIRNSRELARAGCRFSRARLPAVTEGDPAVHRLVREAGFAQSVGILGRRRCRNPMRSSRFAARRAALTMARRRFTAWLSATLRVAVDALTPIRPPARPGW
jgi:hypothetical protein